MEYPDSVIKSLNKIDRDLESICDKVARITDESNPMSENDLKNVIKSIAEYMEEIAD